MTTASVMTAVSPMTAGAPVGGSAPPEVHDLVGVGIGPFNLALAALAEPVRELSCLFLDDRPRFSWHPGMMVDGATLQVPFLADLVTLVDPTSRHSYLAHLRDTGRLFGFYFAERFHVPRAEYEAYCRAVAESLPSCRFGRRVTEVHAAGLPDGADGFCVVYQTADGASSAVMARSLVLGIGTEPSVPAVLSHLCAESADDSDDAEPVAVHSADYVYCAEGIRCADDVTVLGSGQSGAEVVLDLLRRWHRPGRRLRWITRAAAFEPMEYSKIGLEHFTPDYADYFHALPEARRDALLRGQGRLYKAVSAETLADIREELDARSFRPDGDGATGVTLMPGAEAVDGWRDGRQLELTMRHTQTEQYFTVRTGRLVLATGYIPREPALLAPIAQLIERDAAGRPIVGRDHRVRLNGTSASIYVQNAELHTHGVGAPDLGLGAYRAAMILNTVTGRQVHPLPRHTAHTAFAPAAAAAADPGITVHMTGTSLGPADQPDSRPGGRAPAARAADGRTAQFAGAAGRARHAAPLRNGGAGPR
ncbi:MAG TPA: SidA/IucD/PvdA family monooxygenase [Actinocrinis sp.]|jgi:lysine N6-hydroxylase